MNRKHVLIHVVRAGRPQRQRFFKASASLFEWEGSKNEGNRRNLFVLKPLKIPLNSLDDFVERVLFLHDFSLELGMTWCSRIAGRWVVSSRLCNCSSFC